MCWEEFGLTLTFGLVLGEKTSLHGGNKHTYVNK